MKPWRTTRSSRRRNASTAKCLSGSPPVVECSFLALFLDCRFCSSYFITFTSFPSDKLWDLDYILLNVKEAVIPPSIVFSASWALRIKKKKTVWQLWAQTGFANLIAMKQIYRISSLGSLVLSWEYLSSIQLLLFSCYLCQSETDKYTYYLWSREKSSHGLYCPFLVFMGFCGQDVFS